MSNESQNSAFSEALLNWFDRHGRHDLPWQQDKSAYRVWISEIMLQQTQVVTVIPYYLKFMSRFPTLSTLAEAPADDVLSHWSGLGYYARARNLHKAAQKCTHSFSGELPDTTEELQSLPGIGRSTAAAVLSISQNQNLAILDGNVKRVLCRYLGIYGWPGNTQVEKLLWREAERLTPSTRNSDYTQAIMDFGATLCTRSRPACDKCPFATSCHALKNSAVADLPEKKPKKSLPTKAVWMIIFVDQEQTIYFAKRPDVGIWGGLWSLPEIENAGAEPNLENIARKLSPTTESSELQISKILDSFKHTFSHYHLNISPILVKVKSEKITGVYENNSQWLTAAASLELGLPAPVRKIIKNLLI